MLHIPSPPLVDLIQLDKFSFSVPHGSFRDSKFGTQTDDKPVVSEAWVQFLGSRQFTSVRITLIRNTDNLINLISAYSLPVVRSIGQKGIIIIEFPLGIEWPRYHHSVFIT
jgi:hypothetical protein